MFYLRQLCRRKHVAKIVPDQLSRAFAVVHSVRLVHHAEVKIAINVTNHRWRMVNQYPQLAFGLLEGDLPQSHFRDVSGDGGLADESAILLEYRAGGNQHVQFATIFALTLGFKCRRLAG